MPAPIFIIGSPRSGTSALTWALGQHPNIALLPETNWLPVFASGARDAFRVGSARGAYSHLSNAGMPYEAFMAMMGEAADRIALDSFERRLELHLPGLRRTGLPPQQQRIPKARLIHDHRDPKRRWVDGTPDNTGSIYPLTLLFPDARFIHLLRHPEAVANSLAHFANAGADGADMPPAAGAEIWLSHVRAAAQAEQALGAGRLLRLDNEELRRDPETVLARCFAFLGEEADERALLPLRQPVNSSAADGHRDETRERLSGSPVFAEALAFYEELRARPVPPEGDAEVMSALRAAFEASSPAFPTAAPKPAWAQGFGALLRRAGRRR